MEERFGFIHEKLDLKILILFILRRLAAPVSDTALAELTLLDDGIVYFDYTECLDELERTGHIARREDGWVITEKGAHNGEITESSLPYVIRIRAEKRLAPLVRQQKRSALLHTESTPRRQGGVDLHLTMEEDDGPVLELKLLVPNQDQAERMSSHFRSRAETLYNQIVELLLEER